jgi:hypothetical protein
MLWTKRARFIGVSLFLSAGLLAIQFVNFSWRYAAIIILAFLAYSLSAWVLQEELDGIEWLVVLSLPTFYTVAVALFYFLLPERLLTRVIILSAFAVGMYAILLTENIFSIAAGRTIQLLRAAQAVGFLMTLITVFMAYDTIFSFKLAPWSNGLLVLGVSLLLLLQSIWSINLEKSIDTKTFFYTLSLSFLAGQIALVISLWPLSILMSSLFLVAFFYITVGLVQHEFMGRLFPQTIREYLQVAVVVLVVTFLMAGWGGR